MVRRHFLVGQPTDPKEIYVRIRRSVGIDLAEQFFRHDSPKLRHKITSIARSGSPDTFFFRGRPEIVKPVRASQGNANCVGKDLLKALCPDFEQPPVVGFVMALFRRGKCWNTFFRRW